MTGFSGGGVMIGQTLSHYEILAGLGSGGMGDVYRARDTKLGREVAIKVLPEEFTEDPERLARFEREAKTLASLNHPHIAQIHGLEEDDGRRFLVLELVAGETLAARIARGRIPVEEALPIALQIARALEAAHGRGIVHRDVKPANVMLTPDGDAKVLDFGIARPLETAAGEEQIRTRTLDGPPTRPGLAMGTPAYMSPEQLRGERADRRSDIWAFGATLWETLTAARLFEGQTDSDTLAAVLQTSPDWGELPAETPGAVRRLLRRCLERDPRQRLHDIADARLEIEEALAAPDESSAEGSERLAGRTKALRVWQLPAAFGVGAVLILGTVWMLTERGPSSPGPPVRTALSLPPGVTILAGSRQALAISPDGRWLVFRAKERDTWRLFKRALERFDAVSIPGTENGLHPFFSPDGRSVGFFAGGKLKKVLIGGGPVQVLADAPNSLGATWGPLGTIVYCPDDLSGLWRVSDTGGVPEQLVEPDIEQGVMNPYWPEFLPDGSAVLFTNGWGLAADDNDICVLDLESRAVTTLVENAGLARYLPTGHLIFGQKGAVYVAPFDPERRVVTGPSVPIPEPILVESQVGVPHLAFSAGGTLAFIPGGGPPRRRLVSVDLAGNERPLFGELRGFQYPRYSPDGERLAVNISEPGDTSIWVLDLATGARTKLTLEGTNQFPLWSPDGERVTFLSVGTTRALSIDWKRADGSGPREVLIQGQPGEYLDPGSWTPDGESLIYTRSSFQRQRRTTIWIAARDGEREPRPFLPETGTFASALSPDGRWLAYGSYRSGRPEIYVQPFPDGGERRQVSSGGGWNAVWSPDGRSIYYQSEDEERILAGPGDRIMAVPVATTPRFRVGAARVLFEGTYAGGTYSIFRSFDVAPDGNSFVMVKPDEEWGRATEIRVVQNWFEELERIAPVGGSR